MHHPQSRQGYQLGFANDILIFAYSAQTALQLLDAPVESLRRAGLCLSAAKTKFPTTETQPPRAVANCVLIFVLAPPMLRYSAPIRYFSTNCSRSDSVTPLRSVQQEQQQQQQEQPQQQQDEPPRIVLAPMLRYSAPIRYYSTNRSRSDAPLLRSDP